MLKGLSQWELVKGLFSTPIRSSCVNGVDWFKSHNQWLDGSAEPAPGMIIFYDWDSPNGESGPQDGLSDHTGIVWKVEDGYVYTIESYDEQAGAHFTSRDIIYLMTELLIAPEKDEIKENGCTKTAYDMAMGTSQMLGCLSERLHDISEDADLTCFGQEFNPETYAIAKSDMLIKGGNASGIESSETATAPNSEYRINSLPFERCRALTNKQKNSPQKP